MRETLGDGRDERVAPGERDWLTVAERVRVTLGEREGDGLPVPETEGLGQGEGEREGAEERERVVLTEGERLMEGERDEVSDTGVRLGASVREVEGEGELLCVGEALRAPDGVIKADGEGVGDWEVDGVEKEEAVPIKPFGGEPEGMGEGESVPLSQLEPLGDGVVVTEKVRERRGVTVWEGKGERVVERLGTMLGVPPEPMEEEGVRVPLLVRIIDGEEDSLGEGVVQSVGEREGVEEGEGLGLPEREGDGEDVTLVDSEPKGEWLAVGVL